MNRSKTFAVTIMKLALMTVLLVAVGCRTNETPENQVNDAKILADVKAKLMERLGGSTVTNLSVNATNGVLTLAPKSLSSL